MAVDQRCADNQAKDGASMIASSVTPTSSMLRESPPKRRVRARDKRVGANAHDTPTFTSVRALLPSLGEEVHASGGPVHPPIAICK